MDKACFNPDLIKPSGHYKTAFRILTSCVRQKIIYPEEGKSLFVLHDAILKDGPLERIRKHLIRVFTADADNLLQPHTDEARLEPSPADLDKLMERLTGSWLAMYFLGCPLMQAWEAVAFLAEGSGFPRGASLCKAVGDVYRKARKSYLAALNDAHATGEQRAVYVLGHNPLALGKMIDNMKLRENPTAPRPKKKEKDPFVTDLICLGMLYERLQLALYLHAGGPMRFYVPRSSLEQAFIDYESDAGRPRDEQLEWNVAFLWKELEHCFSPRFAHKQFVRIVDHPDLNYMPECILTPTQGIYRTRGVAPKENPGLAGNYLPTRVRTQFEEKMEAVGADKPKGQMPKSLQTGTIDDFRNECQSLGALSGLKDGRPANPGVDNKDAGQVTAPVLPPAAAAGPPEPPSPFAARS
jgi:hypothetical protein